ncbi:MAG: phosphodiester glycosidase family protein, partial [Aquaticitalea sp.]
FAVNGGMFNKNHAPQGLYIENTVRLSELDTLCTGYGNFYLQPNGVFYLTNDGKPIICTTENFHNNSNIRYATQSGPMLVIDSQIHPKFKTDSENMHIRNGVGILPNGDLLFVMSKKIINFYDFASYFKENGCENALYLDGYVSRTYLPEKKWIQNGSGFGVIIAEIKLNN